MSRPALLIVDMVSRFDFPDGARLAKAALPVAERIAPLRARFHRRGWPVVLAVVLALAVGAGATMATIAFAAQRYFESRADVR